MILASLHLAMIVASLKFITALGFNNAKYNGPMPVINYHGILGWLWFIHFSHILQYIIQTLKGNNILGKKPYKLYFSFFFN